MNRFSPAPDSRPRLKSERVQEELPRSTRSSLGIFRALPMAGVNPQDRDVLGAFGDLLLRTLCEMMMEGAALPDHIAALELRGAAEDLRATAAALQDSYHACEPQNELERKLYAPLPRYARRLEALAAEMERSAEV